mmetsp:Transcript_141863/g.441040  ORF Transcript_141863/g.441040 Transcript_141863/m.441040 type:complete len:219 (+) Transcript_141863:79-735(+)
MPQLSPELSAVLADGRRWEVSMLSSPCRSPCAFCYGALCPCCFACQQRRELLDLTGEPYICCGGLCPCCCFASPQPASCLCLEACCCAQLAIAGNRYMLQTRFWKQNDPCDDCIMTFTACLDCVVCLLSITGTPREDLDCIKGCADLVNCVVCACMLTQQQVELDRLKTEAYSGPSAQVLDLLPPLQQQMIGMAKPGGEPQSYGSSAGAFQGDAHKLS